MLRLSAPMSAMFAALTLAAAPSHAAVQNAAASPAAQPAIDAPPPGIAEISFATLAAGEGRNPRDGDQVTVAYQAMLPDGSVVDQSARANFIVGQMITGFDAALRQMQVGGRYRFRVPASLAYGEEGAGPIPPNSDMIFEVTLAGLVTAEEAAAAAAAERAALLAANPITLETLSPGQGATARDGDMAIISYVGRLADGTQFDAGDMASFPVNRVIPGFSEGLKQMQPGGRYRLSIPAALAYGARGVGPIPPNSDLVFEVTVHQFIDPTTLPRDPSSQ